MGFEAINLRRFILAKRVNNKSHPTGWLFIIGRGWDRIRKGGTSAYTGGYIHFVPLGTKCKSNPSSLIFDFR